MKIWRLEQLHNSNLKLVEFDQFKNEDDKRRHPPSTAIEEAERNRHSANAHPLQSLEEKVFEVDETASGLCPPT